MGGSDDGIEDDLSNHGNTRPYHTSFPEMPRFNAQLRLVLVLLTYTVVQQSF
jgi:hypothetical protein